MKKISLKRLLLGRPLRNEESHNQRLSNPTALALLSSDALSSVAYAGQEILVVLALAGAAALKLSLPISISIAVLMLIVVFSYRQTIRAYPHGGGSYTVVKENLGTLPSLVTGSALLVDYILTVAVSISAGTAAITSAFPSLYMYRVPIAVSFVLLLALANLRGVKESGAVFTAPTYAFVVIMAITIIYGVFSYLYFGPQSIVVPRPHEVIAATEMLTLFLIARAFASGCTAMTGIEAIAGSIQVFRVPEWKNARKTLLALAGLLIFLFLGLAWLATNAHVYPSETETVISQITRTLYGTGPFYFIASFSTTAILVLAANTAYFDFPRQASFMAMDDFLPRRFKELGRRLVFSNGVIALSVAAIILIIIFKASTTSLIPLYAVGVFTSFTLSQSGMVVHHFKIKEKGWIQGAVINIVGAIATFIVLLVIAITKFTHGAWMVLIVIPTLISMFMYIKKHYQKSERAAALPEEDILTEFKALKTNRKNHVVVLAKDFDKRLLLVLRYAKTNIQGDLRALHIAQEHDSTDLERRWAEVGIDVPLDIVYSPYRELVRPLLQYIRALRNPGDVVTVVLGEFSPEDPVDVLLHDHISTVIKWALFKESRTVIVSVPFTFGYCPSGKALKQSYAHVPKSKKVAVIKAEKASNFEDPEETCTVKAKFDKTPILTPEEKKRVKLRKQAQQEAVAHQDAEKQKTDTEGINLEVEPIPATDSNLEAGNELGANPQV